VQRADRVEAISNGMQPQVTDRHGAGQGTSDDLRWSPARSATDCVLSRPKRTVSQTATEHARTCSLTLMAGEISVYSPASSKESTRHDR